MKTIISILLTAVLALSFSSCAKQEKNEPNIQTVAVMTVNGEKVTEEEYNYFFKALRSVIITEYAQKYSVEDFNDFWETKYDGKTPSDELEERTVAKCVRAKIELNLCKEYGIYDEVSFAGLKLKALKFNAENEIQSGVVGLKRISLNTFYTYYIETGVMELKNRLEKDVLKPTEAEIQAQIDEIADSIKSGLTDEEIYNSAFDKAVNEKYEKLILDKISKAEIS